MSLIRYNTNDFIPVSFRNLLSTVLGDTTTNNGVATFVPNANMLENATNFTITLEIPGINKEDLKVELLDSYLTVSGERKLKHEEKNVNVHSVETLYGTFTRSFALPEQVDVSKIKAEYNNGILVLTLPKDKKKDKKQIAIKVS